MNKKMMVEGHQPVSLRGYQPVAFPQNVQGQGVSVPSPGAMVNVIPPKGGTGVVRPVAK